MPSDLERHTRGRRTPVRGEAEQSNRVAQDGDIGLPLIELHVFGQDNGCTCSSVAAYFLAQQCPPEHLAQSFRLTRKHCSIPALTVQSITALPLTSTEPFPSFPRI